MIKLYNSLTKQLEEFKPHNSNVVTMYSCGPTVYSYSHIGNMRSFGFVDLLRRVLKYNNYKIDGVINITDVGHLTSDADEGEDKMMVASKKEKKTPWEIAEFYTDFFFSQVEKLNLDLPEKTIKATDKIKQIIEMVASLLEKGFAYETSKGIYYNIDKFGNYGELSGVKPDDKMAGARVEVDEEKLHPADFALWIKAPKEHIMQWDSPWGMGYPGWHIECSAIGVSELGHHIDIHTGGIDLMSIHHENEIAQNYGYCGHDVVKTWMHVEFLQVDGGKMSKSLNNFYTIDDLENKGYNPLSYKYLCLNTHYTKTLNFTFEAMDASETALNRMYDLGLSHKLSENKTNENVISDIKEKFMHAINNGVNAPLALGIVWDMLKNNPKSYNIYELLIDFDRVFGLKIKENINKLEIEKESLKNTNIPFEVEEIAKQRFKAKLEKNWQLADSLRNELASLGYKVIDNKDNSYSIEKI